MGSQHFAFTSSPCVPYGSQHPQDFPCAADVNRPLQIVDLIYSCFQRIGKTCCVHPTTNSLKSWRRLTNFSKMVGPTLKITKWNGPSWFICVSNFKAHFASLFLCEWEAVVAMPQPQPLDQRGFSVFLCSDANERSSSGRPAPRCSHRSRKGESQPTFLRGQLLRSICVCRAPCKWPCVINSITVSIKSLNLMFFFWTDLIFFFYIRSNETKGICTNTVSPINLFKISLYHMTAVLHGSQSSGRRRGRGAEWGRGWWLPASGCVARTGQKGRVLLQDSTYLPLHVSNSESYGPAMI